MAIPAIEELLRISCARPGRQLLVVDRDGEAMVLQPDRAAERAPSAIVSERRMAENYWMQENF